MCAVCVGRLLSYRTLYFVYCAKKKKKILYYTKITKTVKMIVFNVHTHIGVFKYRTVQFTAENADGQNNGKLLRFSRTLRYYQLNFNLILIKRLKWKHRVWDQRTGKHPLEIWSGQVKRTDGEFRSCKEFPNRRTIHDLVYQVSIIQGHNNGPR